MKSEAAVPSPVPTKSIVCGENGVNGEHVQLLVAAECDSGIGLSLLLRGMEELFVNLSLRRRLGSATPTPAEAVASTVNGTHGEIGVCAQPVVEEATNSVPGRLRSRRTNAVSPWREINRTTVPVTPKPVTLRLLTVPSLTGPIGEIVPANAMESRIEPVV